MTSHTIKQAVTYLKSMNFSYSPVTIRRAITDKKLNAAMRTDAPTAFYEIKEDDLLAWAKDPMQHKPGRKVDQKE